MDNSSYIGSSRGYPLYKTLVNDVPIHYTKVGQGPGLVLVHGLRNNWYGWGNIMPLLKEDFTVYALDLPGYGDSGDLGKYSIEIMADYVIAFIKNLPEAPMGVVGLSMGSAITGEIARKYSNNLKGVVLAGPVLRAGHTVGLLKLMKYFMRFMGSNRLTLRLLKMVIGLRTMSYILGRFLSMHKFNKKLIDEYGLEGSQKMRARTYPHMSISVSEYDLLTTVKNNQSPMLLIYGESDRASKPEYAVRKVLPYNQKVRFAIVKKAGHWVVVEQPQQVAAQIRNFYFN